MKYEVKKTAVCLDEKIFKEGWVLCTVDSINVAFAGAEDINSKDLHFKGVRCSCHYDVFEVE